MSDEVVALATQSLGYDTSGPEGVLEAAGFVKGMANAQPDVSTSMPVLRACHPILFTAHLAPEALVPVRDSVPEARTPLSLPDARAEPRVSSGPPREKRPR